MGREHDEQPCCGACARADANEEVPSPARRHLAFELDASGAPIDAVLEVVGADAHPLNLQRVVVGRAADVRLNDSKISRKQFELVFAAGSVAIADLGSSCGTIVNRERIRGPRALCEGDRIFVGDLELRVRRA
jgi:hypothetical protein